MLRRNFKFVLKWRINYLKYKNFQIKTHQIDQIRIVRYEGPVFYVNAECFAKEVFDKLNIKSEKLLKQLSAAKSGDSRAQKPSNGGSVPSGLMKLFKQGRVDMMPNETDLDKSNSKTVDEITNKIGFKNLILDFSCVNMVDLMGANAIIQVSIIID